MTPLTFIVSPIHPSQFGQNLVRHVSMTSTLPPSQPKTRRAPRSFVRIEAGPDETLLLQTAVTTYTRSAHTLHLHSLLHIADTSYYTSLQNDLRHLTARLGVVLFELLTSPANIAQTPYPRLKSRPVATRAARRIANLLRAAAQTDALDPMRPRWRHADVAPIRVPPTPSWPSIVPSALALLALASCLPCPELFAALADTAAGHTHVPPRAALLLLCADVGAARRLAFAAKVASPANVHGAPLLALDCHRNTLAWTAVNHTLRHAHCVALLYGAYHSPALCRCAEADGWSFSSVRWRTAMTLKAPDIRARRLLPPILALAAYVVYCAVDWVLLIDYFALALENSSTNVSMLSHIFLYIARHVGPYVLFRRWFTVWKA